MPQIDLKKFIIPVELGNTDENQEMGNKKFNTTDYVFLDSDDEIKNLSDDERLTSLTDYAIANGGFQWWEGVAKTGKKGTSAYWLRSACSKFTINYVNEGGSRINDYVEDTQLGVCPALHLNLESIISARSATAGFGKVAEVKDPKGNVLYHTIEFGSYPKTKAKNTDEMEKMFDRGQIKATGKKYAGYIKSDGSFAENLEYEYRGEKYVRVQVNRYEEGNWYADGSKVPDKGTWVWIKLEPITWRIRNWDEMPRSINPKGNGRAKFIDVRTEEAVMGGIPFYPNDKDSNISFWQNSSVRGFLNGINVQNIKTNGNSKYGAPKGGDFSRHGFLQEAFDISLENSMSNVQMEEENSPEIPNPYGFTFEELDNDKLLKLYVQSNAAIFLHGPSGVGKSGRVKQLDPTATRITLRPQMNPEEVDGTLDRETGKFIPPLWYTQLCEKCKAEPGRKHVLFIDELTNVKPTVQSLIYSIVLDRAGKDGLWPLPENAVVVAAGNENADNLAAYPLTNALFRRFSHIYYEVDKQNWLDWATGISKVQKQEHVTEDKTERARIHPAIVAYIMSRDEDVLNQDLDEENPHIVTDPRKWEIASNVLYTTKNPNALKPAIGEDLTADFVDFVQSIQLSVEDVVKGRYDARDYEEMDISKKLSTLVGLCMASEKDLGKVRGFISSTMGKEILATYDSLWIRNDPERAEIIAECDLSLLEEGKDNGLEF